MARPTVLTKDNILLLEEAFKKGYNVLEACLHADISKTAYYDYCKGNEKFTDRIDILRNNMLLKAKEIVNDKIEAKDLDTAKWYLERRNKDEFSPRTDLKHEGDKNNPIETNMTVTFVKSVK